MNDPEINRYLESRFKTHSVQSLREYLETIIPDRTNLFLAIVLTERDRHIGNIKLGPIDWTHRFGEVGLLIGDKTCWGKGLATEAIELLTDYAFKALKLHRLTAGCYANNPASAKAFIKAGWQQEGLRRQHFLSEGAYVDSILLGVLNPAT